MMVMMMAITPSLKASSLAFVHRGFVPGMLRKFHERTGVWVPQKLIGFRGKGGLAIVPDFAL